MRAILQRVSQASVTVGGEVTGSINDGLLILLGVGHEDTPEDTEWLIKKIIGMRIFSDTEGKMNISVKDINGSFLVVSQFTLQASTKKGNRPSYIHAARPEVAEPMYEDFCSRLAAVSGLAVEKGIFGADMQVSLINNGPVTIILDSKVKE